MNKLSLKVKITLWYLLIVSVISLAVFLGMTTLSRSIILNDIKDNIILSVNNLALKMTEPEISRSLSDDETIPLHSLYGEGTQTVIYDENKNIVFGQTPYGIENSLPFETNSLRIETYNAKEYYVYDKEIVTNDNKTFWIKGIACISDRLTFLTITLQNNMVIAICFILIAGLGGYLIINKALSPVNKINETARNIINTNNLSERINIDSGNDEIHDLANTVDNMLEKIEASFAKERQFTSDASHELRTPISVILSECEYAEDCITNAEEYKESISSIKKQATKMSTLVSELLAMSRMDNDKMTIRMEETDLSELLDIICDEQIATRNPNIKLKKYIDKDIIEQVDQLLITRLFINIISNAYQYSDESSTITVRLTKQNNKTVFSVEDQGIGISQENIDKIWNRFYQVDSARGAESSGLGLAMVKWIADKHKIDIIVESELNKGSKFSFYFKEDNV